MNKELTTSQAAKLLGLSRQRIWALIKSNRLPAHQIGTQFVIYESDLALVADRKPGRPHK